MVGRDVAPVGKSLPVLLSQAKKNLMCDDKISARLRGARSVGIEEDRRDRGGGAGSGALRSRETNLGRGVRSRAAAGPSWTLGEELLLQKGFRGTDRRVRRDVPKKMENRVASEDEFRSL
jgi:hypothetical protein